MPHLTVEQAAICEYIVDLFHKTNHWPSHESNPNAVIYTWTFPTSDPNSPLTVQYDITTVSVGINPHVRVHVGPCRFTLSHPNNYGLHHEALYQSVQNAQFNYQNHLDEQAQARQREAALHGLELVRSAFRVNSIAAPEEVDELQRRKVTIPA